MAIGTSLGAFFPDKMSFLTAPYQEMDPGIQPKSDLDTNDDNELPGNPGKTNVQEISKKEMPFPDNHDDSTDFVNRFPKDMKSGILNDIKPQDPDRPLLRRINDFTPLSDKDLKGLMWDTPVVKGADPSLNLRSFEPPNDVATGETKESIYNNVDTMLRKSPTGSIRGWHDIDGFEEYKKNLPDDVDVHDGKDGTVIFKLKTKAYTS